jgi:hypothetical protein
MADIQTLINAIPDAQDGNVITSDYHNTIKTVLLAIASQIGAGPAAQTVTLSLQPNLITIGSTGWNVGLGLATSAAGSNGFVPLNLPDGAVIQQLVVMGAQASPAVKAFASLLILPIAGTGSTTLILVDLTPGGNPFNLSGTPNVPGLTVTALASLQTVQNSQFKYAIQAESLGANLTINAFQVVYTTTT